MKGRLGVSDEVFTKQQFCVCRHICGYSVKHVEEGVASKVCDATCVKGLSWMDFRFNGHKCGAGDPSKYGMFCIVCFINQQAAIDADEALSGLNGTSLTSRGHVLMCDIKTPPEAIDCSSDCKGNIHTVWTLANNLAHHVRRTTIPPNITINFATILFTP